MENEFDPDKAGYCIGKQGDFLYFRGKLIHDWFKKCPQVLLLLSAEYIGTVKLFSSEKHLKGVAIHVKAIPSVADIFTGSGKYMDMEKWTGKMQYLYADLKESEYAILMKGEKNE